MIAEHAKYAKKREFKERRLFMNLKYVALAVMVLLVFASWGCGGKTEEELIVETLHTMGDCAEDRDFDGIMDYISDTYADDEERTIEEIGDLLADNIERFRGIVVNILGTRITDLKPTHANVETEVSFSSGAAQLFRKAVRYSGRVYRFNVEMVKEGEKWRVQYASWASVSEREMLPESKKKMEELFPNK